jgi:hypothetical protein
MSPVLFLFRTSKKGGMFMSRLKKIAVEIGGLDRDYVVQSLGMLRSDLKTALNEVDNVQFVWGKTPELAAIDQFAKDQGTFATSARIEAALGRLRDALADLDNFENLMKQLQDDQQQQTF